MKFSKRLLETNDFVSLILNSNWGKNIYLAKESFIKMENFRESSNI